MNCRNHPTRAAVNTCSQCGDWLCEECTADVGGRIYCASCLQKYWAHDHAAPAVEPAAACCPPRRVHGKNVSFGLLFFFTLLPPGINYMYEGLIKRGLFMLSSFFLLGYLSSALNQPLLGLIIPIMWITGAFDAFHIRRRLNAGECVPDSVEDILGFIRKYKVAVILFFVIVLGLSLMGFIGGTIAHVSIPLIRGHLHSIKTILPILILLGGIYFIVLSGKCSCSAHRKHDMYNTPENK